MDSFIQIYNRENIMDCDFPSTEDGQYARRYLVPLVIDGVPKYISNIQTEMNILKVDNLILPLTINETEYDNSYTVSPYTHYITYAIEELYMLNDRKLESVLEFILRQLGTVLKCSKINKTVHVNNWLLSTNLYPKLTSEQIERITEYLTAYYPDHSVVFRSIHDYSNLGFLEAFKKTGYRSIPSRQVYFAPTMNEMTSKQRKQIRRDLKEIEKLGYEVVDIDTINREYDERILELYNLLYIEHYSKRNPQFTLDFIELGIKNKLFHFKALKKDDRIDGVIGYFCRNGFMTTPILGYDTSLPKETGLYRMLTALLNMESEKRGLILHRSSGAASFKRNRGATPRLEYSMVYSKHLPFNRKVGWLVLDVLINKIGKPLLEKYEL